MCCLGSRAEDAFLGTRDPGAFVPEGRAVMDWGPFVQFEWLIGEGLLLAVLFWQLFSLRREQRRDREKQRHEDQRDRSI